MENDRHLSDSEISSLKDLDETALKAVRETLVSLLKEHSRELSDICLNIEDRNTYKQRSFNIIILLFLAYWASTTLLFRYFDSGDRYSSENLLFTLIVSLMLIYFISIVSNQNQKIRLLKRDADILSVKIERLISVASQVEEHFLTNIVDRIELDLNLAGAEAALRHYEDTYKRIFRYSRIWFFLPWMYF